MTYKKYRLSLVEYLEIDGHIINKSPDTGVEVEFVSIDVDESHKKDILEYMFDEIRIRVLEKEKKNEGLENIF